jgi:hypothetical protein
VKSESPEKIKKDFVFRSVDREKRNRIMEPIVVSQL